MSIVTLLKNSASYTCDGSIRVTFGRYTRASTTYDQEEVQKWSHDHPVRREHNKEDQFDPEEAGRNNSKDPTLRSKDGQAAGIPKAEVVNNGIARRGKEEREQQQIPLPRSPSRRRQLQDIKIKLYGFIIHFSDRQSGELLQHKNHFGHLKF
ncbi:hypothetical protein TNCV_850871 [Trichonephila clavipes]|nr:hypothetical protein TNCV_850871 [Trichonephila clavipes]